MTTERLIIQIDDKGSRVVKRNLQQVGTAAAGAGGQVNRLKTALVALGGVAILRNLIGTIADFGKQMSTVGAITEATADEFKDLESVAKALGATTRFSASEAAEGMTFLARAGFEVNEVLESIDDTLRLAQAGALGLGEAADIASNVLTGFRLEAAEAGRVVDILAFAANRSNTNVSQLGQAMKFVAPVAAGVGVSLEEATAAASALSDAGLQASLAGTGLRRILSELESPAAKTTKLLKQMGLEAKDVRVSQVGLTEAITRLAEAGVDTGIALEIFGDRGGPAFEVLSNAIPKVNQMNEALRESEGFALRTAKRMDDNLEGSLKAVSSAAESLKLSLGLEDGLEKVFRGLADALRFLSKNTDVLIGILTTLAITALPAVVAGIKALTLAIIANPFGLLLTVVAAAIGALIAFKDEIKVTGDGMVSLGDLAGEVWRTIKDGINALLPVMNTVLSIMTYGFITATDDIRGSFEDLLQAIALVFDASIGLALGTVKALQNIFALLPRALDATGGFEVRFKDLRQAAEQGWQQGFQGSDLGKQLVDGIFEGARERARLRMDELMRDAIANAPKPEDVGFVGPVQQGGAVTGGAGQASAMSAEAEIQASQQVVAAIDQVNQKLVQEADLLQISARERDVRTQLLEIENELQQKGIDTANEGISVALADIENKIRDNQLLAEKARLLQLVRGENEAQQLQQEGLQLILDDNNITLEEKNRLLEVLKGRLENTPWEDFKQRVLGAKTAAEALEKTIGDALVRAIDRAVDALADFALSGFKNVEDLKKAFSDLFRDLSKEILKLIIKILILKALEAAFGGGAKTGGTVTAGKAAMGGTITARQGGGLASTSPSRAFLVGERGPELFVPQRSGNIIPANQVAQAAPEVNVSVVNVSDPDEIPTAMNSPKGEEVILNVLQRNSRTVKRIAK